MLVVEVTVKVPLYPDTPTPATVTKLPTEKPCGTKVVMVTVVPDSFAPEGAIPRPGSGRVLGSVVGSESLSIAVRPLATTRSASVVGQGLLMQVPDNDPAGTTAISKSVTAGLAGVGPEVAKFATGVLVLQLNVGPDNVSFWTVVPPDVK